MPELRVTEIFHSLQGESRTAGLPTVFVRLTGCPLRCTYCDTAYAFSGGSLRTIEEIVSEVQAHQTPRVCVTGGEPLAQPACLLLLVALCDKGWEVSLETSGALDVSGVDPRVSTVMDLKTPGSGEVHRNRFGNVAHLKPADQVKFVVCNRDDYLWARDCVREHALADRVGEILFSPSFGELAPRDLAQWILEDRLPVRMQVQLHKIIWGEERGR